MLVFLQLGYITEDNFVKIPTVSVFTCEVPTVRIYSVRFLTAGPPLWSSGQGSWLQIQRSWVRFPALPDFLSGGGSGTGSTQPCEPREVN
jgi:hypothetical protein